MNRRIGYYVALIIIAITESYLYQQIQNFCYRMKMILRFWHGLFWSKEENPWQWGFFWHHLNNMQYLKNTSPWEKYRLFTKWQNFRNYFKGDF